MINFVKKKIEILFGVKNDSKHIAFTCTDNYVPFAGIAITSILETSKTSNFTFHIFSKSFCKDDIDKLKTTAEKRKTNIILYYVSEDIFNNSPNPGIYTYASYYRIILPKFFEGVLSEFLYLDVDVCAYQNISSLWNVDISKVAAGVVKDDKKGVGERIGIKNYFLSGGLFINVKKWNEENITEKCLQLMAENRKWRYPDQDILNIVLENNIKFIDKNYNYHYSLSHLLDNSNFPSKEKTPEKIIIIHFAGHSKPWHDWVKTLDAAKKYLNIKSKSQWSELPLIKPQTYKEMHKAARLAKKEGTLKEVLYWYSKYALTKVMRKL